MLTRAISGGIGLNRCFGYPLLADNPPPQLSGLKQPLFYFFLDKVLIPPFLTDLAGWSFCSLWCQLGLQSTKVRIELFSPQATQGNCCCYNHSWIFKLLTKAKEWIFSNANEHAMRWLWAGTLLKILERDCTGLVTLYTAHHWIFNSWRRKKNFSCSVTTLSLKFYHPLRFCAL